MRIMVVTLQNKATGEKKVVSVPNRAGKAMWLIHAQLMKENPGYYIQKTVNK